MTKWKLGAFLVFALVVSTAVGGGLRFTRAQVGPSADLELTGPAFVAATPGQPVTISMTLRNNGPDTATNIVVSFIDFSFNNSQVDRTVASLAPGAQVQLSADFTFPAASDYPVLVEVAQATPGDPDSTPGGGGPGEDDQVFVTVSVSALVLQIVSGPSALTNNSQPGFLFSASDPAGLSEVVCRFDASAFEPCPPGALITPPAPLVDGGHTFEVRATNTLGQVRTATRSFTVDTSPPTITITGGPAAGSTTNDSTPTFTFTATDPHGPIQFDCRIDTPGFAPCSSPYTKSLALADGPHTFEVRAFDGLGNFTSVTRSFNVSTVIDTDGDGVTDGADNCPAVANPGQQNFDGDAQGDACDADDDNDNILDGPDACDATPAGLPVDPANGCHDFDTDGVFFPADNCPVSANPTQADADGDGVGDACDSSDTTKPIVKVPADIVVTATSPNGATVQFTATAVDPPATPLPVTCVPASGSLFPIGTNTVSCSATDAAGNTGTASFKVIVKPQTGGGAAPEAIIRFDPATKDIAVFGAAGGARFGPIAPTKGVSNHRQGEHGCALRTYVLTAPGGGESTELKLCVKREGKEIEASVLTIRYGAGAPITPGRNEMKFEWNSERGGSVDKLNQKFRTGAEGSETRVEARFEKRSNSTVVEKKKPEPRTRTEKAGLFLLELSTQKGSLAIGY